MPYPNEHAARLVDPEEFDPDSFRRVNDKFGDGIHAIFGKLKGEDSMTLQAVRFDADKFTAEEAKKWLKEHDYHPTEFEEASSQKALSYFVPLAKADEAKREVWGTAAVEQPDASGEIMDYERSKPHFLAWSEKVRKASGGKSYGNIRDSHTTKAVGKVIKLVFDDESKAIRVGAKIVDSEAWQKVLEGVFTGFSIGGVYGKRWPDPIHKGFVRYEAIPMEISLVDLPCIPGATIEVVKADGSIKKLSMRGVTMKDKILKLLKELDPEDQDKVEEIAAQIADLIEEQQGDEESSDSSEESGQSQEAEAQPLTEDKVRQIVIDVLLEFGLIDQGMKMGAKIHGLVKSEMSTLTKQFESVRDQLVKDVAKLALEVEKLAKRGVSGPVLREIGTLNASSGAALQKVDILREALRNETDPLVRQALQNEIARLEIQQIHAGKKE